MRTLTRLAVAVTVSGLVLGAPLGWGAASQARAVIAGSDSRGTQGYLGVDVRDVDTQRAAALKLKEATGAEITSVDHDAPAGKVGLRVHDVILAMNGETIEGEAQLRRMLRETPAGRKIQLKVWRDGKQQDVAVQLADRAQVAAEAWPQGQIVMDGFPSISMNGGFPSPAMIRDLSPDLVVRQLSLLGGGGLDVEPIGKQLADYFGVPNGTGLLVRMVAPDGDGAAAGLKAGDVITKANGQPAETLRAWMMVMAQNQGKPVQLKVIRNHKEQTLSYTPGGAKKKSELELPEFDGDAAARVQQQQASIDANRIAEEVRRTVATLDVLQQVDMTWMQAEIGQRVEELQLLEPQLDEQLLELQEVQPEIDRQMQKVREWGNTLEEFD